MTFSASSLLQELTPYLGASRFVVAYSGGVDSHVLLAAMAEIQHQLKGAGLAAVHVDHGVNNAAAQWVEHCQEVCRKLSVSLEIKTVRVENSRSSLENELRKVRYQAFAECLLPSDLLLLAHHADDQAETLLLRLLRGSGALGASGIPRQRALAGAKLVRPLLAYTQEELMFYAEQKGLQWIEDDSNLDQNYDRNYLRHSVMPLIEQRWPGYRKTLVRHTDINQQLQQSLDFFINRELEYLREGSDQLNIERLREYELPLQLNLLRGWLRCLNLTLPSFDQLQGILTQVVAAKTDAQPEFNWPGVSIHRYQNRLYAAPPLAPHAADRVCKWDLDEPLQDAAMGKLSAKLSTGAGINPALINKVVTVRFRQGGERCRPAGRQGTHPLKKLLQEYHVPPWLRDRVPLIYVDDELAAVADLWVCDEYCAPEKAMGYQIIWRPSA